MKELFRSAQDKAFKFNILKHDFIKSHVEKVELGDFKSEVSSYLYFYERDPRIRS